MLTSRVPLWLCRLAAGLLFGLWLVLCAQAARPSAAPPRPNIIIILADDMGYSDIGCYGSEINTPHLDGLAAQGLRFTQFYNSARCCPTRASLLTGLHPHQTGVGHMMEDRGYEGYRGRLNRRCVTLAEALKTAGYRSYAVGKWHLTPGTTARELEDISNWPLQRGFDRFYGTIHGAGSYWDPSALVRDNRLITAFNDPEYQPEVYYYTDAISDQAVRFVREHVRQTPQQPFFLYVAYTAAHWPMHAKESDIAKYRGRYDGGYAAIRQARWQKQQQLGVVERKWSPVPLAGDWSKVPDRAFEARCMEVYAAMVDCMDQGIGRLLEALRETGQWHNTLMMYLQDNGACAENVGRGTNATPRAAQPTLPPMGRDIPQQGSIPKQTRDGWPVRQGYGVMPGGPDTYVAYGGEWANVSNTPFREYKHWVHEGGIATPLIVHWPAGIPASRRGKVEKQPGQLMDIMATCLDVAGVVYPTEYQGQKITPLEGTSLRPAFTGKTIQRSHPLVWEHEGNRAIREGRWKLVATEHQPWELYDMNQDRTEMNNLADKYPAKVKTMAAAWDAWAARADVLPLGAWRARPIGETDTTPGSKEKRFLLKAGDSLTRAQAPAIAKKAFRITAQFQARPEDEGVIVAQGGNALGYGLYLKGGQVHFTVRNRAGASSTVSAPLPAAAQHEVVALLNDKGEMLLTVGQQPPKTGKSQGLITAMPQDGLQVGADENGAVGAYAPPFTFKGKTLSVIIEILDP
ncbi:MAG: arylsulfatase [Verrucomicrobiae bacterium]|nr:arylsulfatase [Verrucomicrobiae bacterium]